MTSKMSLSMIFLYLNTQTVIKIVNTIETPANLHEVNLFPNKESIFGN